MYIHGDTLVELVPKGSKNIHEIHVPTVRLVCSLYVSAQNKANHYNNDNICHDCDF